MNFVRVRDLTFCTRVKGDGLPLVFINSLGTDYRIWDTVAPAFASDHRIVRYDKRGHGLSDCPPAPYSIRDSADDLAGLLDALQINQAVVVGISVGGLIAMDLATAFPQRVTALILCDTFPKIGTADMWNTRIFTLREGGMDAAAESILARWFAPDFAARNPAVYSGYYNMLVRTPVEGYTGMCEAICDADLTEAARTIQKPTLVLCGAKDAATPPDLVRDLTQIIPDAQYVEIPDAGHLPCVENPAAMIDAMRVFLKTVY